jgi:hypothetical protein
MRCNASRLEIDLMPNNRIVLTLRCDSSYEAAVMYDEIKEAAKKGNLNLDFVVKNIPVAD